MFKALCLIALALASGGAAAAWVMLSETEAAIVYFDSDTVLRNGDRATLSELTDYKIVPNVNRSTKSARRVYQFDCMEGALRTLSIATYSGSMANGEVVVAINEPTSWLLFMPGSVGEILWNTACGRRGRAG